MLRPEENERLVRVGPGTPAGELFRRYWQPAALSRELPERDGAPVRVRLLGEDLVTFRDSTGRVGLLDAYCRHRRAPLFFGRNEECGLRCVYHGWKFDADGTCVDMPSEPTDSPLKAGAAIKSYPTVERGGLVWAYLGPPDKRPGEPDFEWTRAPATHRTVSKSLQTSNYLQGLEGGLDTAHVSFLHNNRLGDRSNYFVRDGAPKIEVYETPYGYNYVSHRKFDDDKNFIRLYQYVMPFQQMRPNIVFSNVSNDARVPRYDGHIWVPVDDEHTNVYNFMCGSDEACALDPDFVERIEAGYGRGNDDYIPGTFSLKASLENDYFIDRQVQKRATFTGIRGINTQDIALQEGMGALVDRAREFLGTSDRAIVVMRKLLIEATNAVARGEAPRGSDAATFRDVRPYDAVLPAEGDWRRYFADTARARW